VGKCGVMRGIVGGVIFPPDTFPLRLFHEIRAPSRLYQHKSYSFCDSIGRTAPRLRKYRVPFPGFNSQMQECLKYLCHSKYTGMLSRFVSPVLSSSTRKHSSIYQSSLFSHVVARVGLILFDETSAIIATFVAPLPSPYL
jgi:hypothetical protein